MILAISKNSWHYKLYNFLIIIWGGDKNKQITSLCIYNQILFCGGFLTLMISPFLAGGWCIIKFSRVTYKILSKFSFTQTIIDKLDNSINLFEHIDKVSKESEDSFVLTCFLTFLITLVCFIIIGVVWAMIMATPGFLIKLIPQIPYIIWIVFMYIGWLIFLFFGLMGFLETVIVKYIWSVITWIFIKFLIILPYLFHWLYIVSIFVIVGYITYKILSSKSVQPIINFLIFKYNGFHESYKNNKVRRVEELKNSTPTENLIDKFCNKIFNFLRPIYDWLIKILVKLIDKFCGTKTIIKGETYKVLGMIPLIWNIFKSFLKEVCPFVQFIDEEKK